MVNFKIIENSPPVYMEKYEEFIELYNDKNITVEEIRQRLGWRTKVYNDARNKALEENRIIDRRSKNSIENCKGRPVKEKHIPKYYHYDRWYGKFVIVKKYYRDKKEVVSYYGCYNNEKVAQAVVNELKKVDWDKSKLKDIKQKLGLL